MLFTCIEDFYNKADRARRLSRDAEKEAYLRMKAGDAQAKESLVESYLFFVASRIKRLSADMQSLELVYSSVGALERAVDKYDFSGDGDTFAHHLGFVVQREITKYIAEKN